MDKKICEEIKILYHLIGQNLRNNDLNLSFAQCYLINTLENSGGSIDQSVLEEKFKIRRSSLSTLIKNMEKDSLIFRLPVDNDKRKKEIFLSKKGRDLSKMIKENIDITENKLSNSLTSEEKEKFFVLLEKLKNGLSGVEL